MMALMSTSLNVVSMAAVFCASLRRRAMVWRRRVMRTRSSRAASLGTDGARICVTGTGTVVVIAEGAAAAAPAAAGWRGGGLGGSGRHVLLEDLAAPAGALHVGLGRAPSPPSLARRR